MSYDPRLASRPYGVPEDDEEDDSTQKGSVRAARQRLQADRIPEQLPDRSRIIGLPQRPNQLVSNFSTQNQRTQPQQPSGNAFSQPQWPLPNNAEEIDSEPGQSQRASGRGPAPQRPPRPVPDELSLQPTSPGQYRESYQSDDILFSPTSGRSSRPLTTSSVLSDASSLGDIPDFPIPQPPMPTIQPLPRRQPSLGPPPSARRGPSSYYTQISYVSPIAEESETRSDMIRSHHGSFASSMAIPSNVNDYYVEDDRVLSDDEETITSFDEKGDYEKESGMSDHDDRSELVTPALVRQASMGRRTKPSLMTIRSVDSFGEKKGSIKKKGPAVAGAAGIGGAILAARDGISGRAASGASTSQNAGPGFLDPSLSSNESLGSFKNSNSRSEPQRVFDFEKETLSEPVHPLSQSSRKQRPPKLNMDAVRDAEARGSLTSLPELIRRATRLAANLDRGKTASRLGLDFWEQGAPDRNRPDIRRSGSLTDMLAAFPPPGEATPTGAGTPNPKRMDYGGRAGDMTGTESAFSNRKSNRRRRCCGMPMWTFVTLLIVLLFLVAAAVVIPIVLIVIPRMRDSQTPERNTSGVNNSQTSLPTAVPTIAPQPGQCENIISCQNGGVAIPQSDRTCNCVCINGFTGRTCATRSEAGCTTTDVAGAANNATVGTGIPRLLATARSNFSIPLDAPQLLSIFSNLGMSCTAENALITFNGLASRSVSVIVEGSLEESSIPSRSLPLDASQPHDIVVNIQRRQTIGQVNTPAANTATPTQNAVPSSTAPISSNPRALDFARIGVLLVLQESKTLDTAANAQVAIQDYLTDDRSGNRNVAPTLKIGTLEMNLRALTIRYQNGTTLQARPQ